MAGTFIMFIVTKTEIYPALFEDGVTLVRRVFALFVMWRTVGISINAPHLIICHSKCDSICNCLKPQRWR